MITDLWMWLVPAALAGVLLLAVLYRQIYRVGDLSAEQVVPSLSPLGAMGVHDLFSDAAEHYLRATLAPQQFRRAQHHRMVLALEYIRRISHNARVLQQWGTHELGRARDARIPDYSHLSVDLIAATVHCRICSLVLRTRLYFCLFLMTLLPFTGAPSFEALIRFGKVDLLDFYSKMRAAAGKLGSYYGEGHQNKLAQLL